MRRDTMVDIDGNELLRGDYVLYVHDRLGLIYARIIYNTPYKVCLFPLHEKASKRKTYLYRDKKTYLLPEDEVPQEIKNLALLVKMAHEYWG
jgi:hypothetical protein